MTVDMGKRARRKVKKGTEGKKAPQDAQEPPQDAAEPTDDPKVKDETKPGSGAQDAPQGGMSEQQIRDAGLMIDVPFEAPDPNPEAIQYADDAAETWVPTANFQMGGVPWDQLPPIDPQISDGAEAPPNGSDTSGSTNDGP